ncbi:MAG: sialidase family protein [Pseudomonadota bacterium]
MPLRLRPARRHRGLLVCIIAIAFGAAFYKVYKTPPAASFQPVPAAVSGNSEPLLYSDFASSRQLIQTHAASLIELKNGHLRAFWFSGSREGARDVEIHTAVFDPVRRQWSTEQSIATRSGTQQALVRYISKLGNPVPARAADGTLWLYYVTVSIGGWAGSSIAAITSQDEGVTWSRARRLVSSPFFNISTLVKGAPFLYSDGTMGLPVYHEFISKFGELLRLDKTGAVIDKQRLSAGGEGALQPVVLTQSPRDALVLMRHSGAAPRRVLGTATHDAGQHWSRPAPTALPNPDAALAAVTLTDGRLLAILNDAEQGRDALALVISADGGANWKKLYRFEDQSAAGESALNPAHYSKIVEEMVGRAGPESQGKVKSAQRQMCKEQSCRFEFSYPYLIKTQSGELHLVYTWNRSFIKHVAFTQAWLDQRVRDSDGLH